MKDLREVLIEEKYDADILRYLFSSSFAGATGVAGKDIVSSIEEIIANSLEESSGSKEDAIKEYALRCTTFIFGDIHGRLDVFLQNLYAAKLIDKVGNWIGDNKTLILTGDLFNAGGPYSLETLLYVYALQTQAKKKQGNIEICLGNHEIDLLSLIYYLENLKKSEQETIPQFVIDRFSTSINLGCGHPSPKEYTLCLAKILLKGYLSRKHVFYYADDSLRIDVTHAGIQKSVRIRMLEQFMKTVITPSSESRKLLISDIEVAMRNRGLTHKRLADIVNRDIFENSDVFLRMSVYCYFSLRCKELSKTIDYLKKDIEKSKTESDEENKKIATQRDEAKIKSLQKKISDLEESIRSMEEQLQFYLTHSNLTRPTVDVIKKYGYIHAEITCNQTAEVFQGLGLYYSTKKATRSLKCVMSPESIKLLKYMQVVGHMPTKQGSTEKGCYYTHDTMNGVLFGQGGFVTRIHNSLFVDANMMYGNQSFVGFDNDGKIMEFCVPSSCATTGKRWERGIKRFDISMWRVNQIHNCTVNPQPMQMISL